MKLRIYHLSTHYVGSFPEFIPEEKNSSYIRRRPNGEREVWDEALERLKQIKKDETDSRK